VPGGEGEIARDLHAERQVDGLDLAQREDAEFRIAEAEVRQPVLCRAWNYVESAVKRGGLADR
jgi:hypothetical protein